jgi:hypothetical protein
MQSDRIKSSFASLQVGAGHSDGTLTLTADYLQFEPFNQHYGLSVQQLHLTDIVKVEPCWGKGAGFIPLTSEAMQIHLKDGTQYQFILTNPDQWIAALSLR